MREGLLFIPGDRVLVEGMDALVVKVDEGDSLFPYLVCLLELERLDWYMETQVKPCPSSE